MKNLIIDAHFHWPVFDSNGASEVLELLDRYGFSCAVLCGLEVFDKTRSSSLCNDALAVLRDCAPGRISALGTVFMSHPRAPEEARRCFEKLGMKGLKIHPWLQGESVSSQKMLEVAGVCEEFDAPVMFHDGTPCYSLPGQIGLLASRRPGARIVLGHSGILHFWEEALEVILRYKNVYGVLAGGHPHGMQRICDSVPAERLMFGTDYTGPGSEEFIAYRLGLAMGLALPDEKRKIIMFETAKRLFGFE